MKFRFIVSAICFSCLTLNSAQADCKADIQAIMKAMEASPPYRVAITSTAAGVTTEMEGEVILPHSMRMNLPGMSMVMTPNGVWMGQAGELKKMPDGMREQVQDIIKQGMNLGMKGIEAPECAGSTSFEGGDFDLYKYTAKGEVMGINSTSSVEMYVNGDRRPEWMVIDGEAMGVKSLTKQHIIYDDSIVIADPN